MEKNLPGTLRRGADFIEDVMKQGHPEDIRWTPWYVKAMREAADELERLERRKARWKEMRDGHGFACRQCPSCGHFEDEKRKANFCWFCGADMREDESDEATDS